MVHVCQRKIGLKYAQGSTYYFECRTFSPLPGNVFEDLFSAVRRTFFLSSFFPPSGPRKQRKMINKIYTCTFRSFPTASGGAYNASHRAARRCARAAYRKKEVIRTPIFTCVHRHLVANGAEVGIEAALETEQQLYVIVRHHLQSLIDSRDVERDRLQKHEAYKREKINKRHAFVEEGRPCRHGSYLYI